MPSLQVERRRPSALQACCLMGKLHRHGVAPWSRHEGPAPSIYLRLSRAFGSCPGPLSQRSCRRVEVLMRTYATRLLRASLVASGVSRGRQQVLVAACLLSCLGGSLGLPSLALAKPGDVVRTIPCPASTPTGLAFDGKWLWVADRRTASIRQVDPKDGTQKSSTPAPGWQPEGLASDGKALWVADGAERKLYRIDPAKRWVLQVLDAPSRSPRGLAYDGKRLWVADDRRGEIIAVDPRDGAEVASVKVPVKDVRGIAFDGQYLWVADRILDRIFLVDPTHDEVIFFVPAPGPHVQGLAWDRAARKLWAVDYQTDTIYQLQADDNTPYARFGGKEELLDLTHVVRNLGPDAVRDVRAFFAVPSSRESQEVLSVTYEGGTPSFEKDEQGQRIARFGVSRLEAGRELSITMRVHARLFGVQWYVFPHKVGPLSEVPANIRGRYLGDDPKYQMQDPFIRTTALQVIGKEKNPYWIARKLARFVTEKMRYEMSGGWEAAPLVLRRGTGSCSEYTFAFVALARAVGLPARWVGAVVVRGDDASWDVDFHRWAEIYLPRYGWVPWDVQHADQPTPAAHAEPLGRLDDRVLITTVSGGYSSFLDWSYNTNARFVCEGRCQVASDAVGEWTPATSLTGPRGTPHVNSVVTPAAPGR